MFINIIVFGSLLTLVCGAAIINESQNLKINITPAHGSKTRHILEKPGNEQNTEPISSEKVIIEIYSDEEDDEDEDQLSSEELLLQKNAEEDVKDWIKKLNCRKTPMTLYKCHMVKRTAARYFSRPDRNPEMLKIAIPRFMSSLRTNNRVDPGLQRLVDKYKMYLNDV